MLVVVGGLPGAGKSSLADALANRLGVPVFNKDQIEASLWRSGITADLNSCQGAEDLLGTLAGEQLRRNQSAILDTVARTGESREAWHTLRLITAPRSSSSNASAAIPTFIDVVSTTAFGVSPGGTS